MKASSSSPYSMANSLCKFSTFIICLALLFPVYADEVTVNEVGDDRDGDGICEVPSGLFHGPCWDTNACNNLCKGGEGAQAGLCSDDICVCRKTCQKRCPRPSARFHGLCSDSIACNNLCKDGEGAAGGECRDGLKCICYHNC